MIRTVIFDLERILVHTERLKTISQVWANAKIWPYQIKEGLVLAAFKKSVSIPRQELDQTLIWQLGLQEKAVGRGSHSAI